MDFVETEGDTIDQAIENALKQLGVERDKITVEVLSEGREESLASERKRHASVPLLEPSGTLCITEM